MLRQFFETSSSAPRYYRDKRRSHVCESLDYVRIIQFLHYYYYCIWFLRYQFTFICLKWRESSRGRGRGKDRERDPLICLILPHIHNSQTLQGQAYTRSTEFHLAVLCEREGPKCWIHHCCLPECTSRIAETWTTCSETGCECSNWRLHRVNLHCDSIKQWQHLQKFHTKS